MIALFLFLLCHAPLMTTSEQCQWLVDCKERILERLKRPTDANALYVSAILQGDSSNTDAWAVWINEQKWTHTKAPQGPYTIKSVTPSHLTLNIDGRDITLRANQSYSPLARAVFDGDLRTTPGVKDQGSGV
jgi:hypothetical protein